jgi:LPXTG-site transpeptidase (sortase) family protein
MRRTRAMRWMVRLVAVALIGLGAYLVGMPLFAVHQRGTADTNALNSWSSTGNTAVVGAPRGGAGDPKLGKTCGSELPVDQAYALVTFTGLPQYGYAGVAGDGNWDLLQNRSMVHYAGTPGPGGKGNMIIAFHREPNYEHIDQLQVGMEVDVQDRSCRQYKYRVTQRWEEDPNHVTQLVPTDGQQLTLISCTPWWRDTSRLVWRAQLIA